ncbi:MAG: hypothetical protein KF711_10415 [Nitrospira sp.]|nr:hypothetical protein [Nitrospira sp.]
MKPEQPDWATKWRDLAKESSGVTPDDPRLNSILSALALADTAYKSKDLATFEQAAARVRRLMKLMPVATIEWERHDRTTQRGLIDFLHHDETGGLWIFLTTADGRQLALNAAACNFQIET